MYKFYAAVHCWQCLYSLTNDHDRYNTSGSSDFSCSAYPPWFILNFDKSAEKCQCGDQLGGRINCDNAVYINHCYCTTYNDILGTCWCLYDQLLCEKPISGEIL